MIGIYKITSPSNKVYIGQSINIEKRFNNYKRLDCKNQKKLYNSFLKYGVSNHIFEVIIECLESDLNKNESYYINLYKSTYLGLNIMEVDINSLKYRHSKESKKKMSESRIGKKQSESHRIKSILNLSKNRYVGFGKDNPFYGKKHSEETINIIKKKNSEYVLSHAQKEKHLIATKINGEKRKGIKFNETWKKNMSESHKGKRKGGLNNKAKIVLNTENGIFYECLKDAFNAYCFKYSYRYIGQMLSGVYKNKTSLIYI
jgi:group I intron endonuclease